MAASDHWTSTREARSPTALRPAGSPALTSAKSSGPGPSKTRSLSSPNVPRYATFPNTQRSAVCAVATGLAQGAVYGLVALGFTQGAIIGLACAIGFAGLALWAYFVLPVPWDTLPDGSRDFGAYRTFCGT